MRDAGGKCTVCGVPKSPELFSRHKHSKDGLYSICRACKSAKVKEWASKNKLTVAKQSRARFQRHYTTVPGRMAKLAHACRGRAAQKNIPYNLDKQFLIDMWNRQNGLCAVLGTPLELNIGNGQLSHPNGPSVDRIDSTKGYTRDNVRLVCLAANIAMNVWGVDMLDKLVSARVKFLNVV